MLLNVKYCELIFLYISFICCSHIFIHVVLSCYQGAFFDKRKHSVVKERRQATKSQSVCVCVCMCGFDVFDVTAVPYCPQKCRSALGRQRSEAALICLTAFTEMFRGHIQRSLGGVLVLVCPPTPLLLTAHSAYNRVDRSARVIFRKVTVKIGE